MLKEAFWNQTWYCDHLSRFLTFIWYWNENMSMRVWLCQSVRLWDPKNTAVQDNNWHLPASAWMYDESQCAVSTSHHLQSLQPPIISLCYHRQLSGTSQWLASLFSSPCIAPPSDWVTVWGKHSSEHHATFFFSSWTVLNRLDSISGNQWLRQNDQVTRTHTHRLKYTHLHTIIHMYTCIVFDSCLIRLCKYKCITFQILQHKCW